MNNKTILDLREQLFKWQKARQQFNDIKTMRLHLNTFLEFEPKLDIEVNERLCTGHVNFQIETVKGYHINVVFGLDILHDCIRFRGFEIESKKSFDFSKQNEMMILRELVSF